MVSLLGLFRLLYLLFVYFFPQHYPHANEHVGHVPLRRHRTRHSLRLANAQSRGMVASTILGVSTHSYLRCLTSCIFACMWVVSRSWGVEAVSVVVGAICVAWFHGVA
jgi:hypothetical protein